MLEAANKSSKHPLTVYNVLLFLSTADAPSGLNRNYGQVTTIASICIYTNIVGAMM